MSSTVRHHAVEARLAQLAPRPTLGLHPSARAADPGQIPVREHVGQCRLELGPRRVQRRLEDLGQVPVVPGAELRVAEHVVSRPRIHHCDPTSPAGAVSALVNRAGGELLDLGESTPDAWRMRRSAILLAILLSLGGLVACGDDDDDGEAPRRRRASEETTAGDDEMADTADGAQDDTGGDAAADDFPIPVPDGSTEVIVFDESTRQVNYAADDFDRVVAFYQGWVAEQPETYTEDPVSETGAGWRPEEGSGSPVQNIIVAKTLGDDGEEITLVNISIVP